MDIANLVLYPVVYVLEKCRDCLQWVLRMLRVVKSTPAVHGPQGSARRRIYTTADITEEIRRVHELRRVPTPRAQPPDVITFEWTRLDAHDIASSSYTPEAKETPEVSEEEQPETPKMILPPPEPIALPWYKAIADKPTSESNQEEEEEAPKTPKSLPEHKPDVQEDLNNNTGNKTNMQNSGYRRQHKPSGQSRSANTSQTRYRNDDARTKAGFKPAPKDIKRAPFMNSKRWAY